mmetsp:Transcript_10625/g.25575  ORF Transcript_10625/g.25575 Transcript_10625/m.25575 type:complete len:80 (+) Transcript_10625:1311-1550(+)
MRKYVGLHRLKFYSSNRVTLSRFAIIVGSQMDHRSLLTKLANIKNFLWTKKKKENHAGDMLFEGQTSSLDVQEIHQKQQ